MVEAAQLIRPTEVVLPDTAAGMDANMAAFQNAIRHEGIGQLRIDGCRFMFVPHGNHLAELKSSARTALRSGFVDSIGLGKPLLEAVSQGLTVGRKFIWKIMETPSVPVHFLSFYTPAEIFMPWLGDEAVRGCDSSLPAIAAAYYITFEGPFGLLHRPYRWKFDPTWVFSNTQLDILRHNIAFIIEGLGNELKTC